MNTESSEKVYYEIINGEYDDDLQTLADAITDRRKIIARRLQPGDVIRFVPTIKPRYLAGLTATVRSIENDMVRVECPDDPRYRRFSANKAVRVPMTLIAGRVDARSE